MLESVKEVLTKDIDLKEVLTKEYDLKEILEKEIETKHLKEFLAQEIEIKKLKELLATEIKLKEFLVQEIDIKKMFSSSEKVTAETDSKDTENQKIETIPVSKKPVQKAKHIMLPPYDYTLIESLNKSYEEIQFVHSEIMKFTESRKYESVASRLDYFSTMIKAHFQRADKELYSYLKMFIQQKYPKREKAFTELSLEMKNIAIEIFFSLIQSPNIPVNEATRESFLTEFHNLGELLDRRIHREETVLFVMYEESNEALDIS